MKRIVMAAILLLVSVQVFCAAPRAARSIKNKPHDTGEVLVIFKKTLSQQDISGFNSRHNTSLSLLPDMISAVEANYSLVRTRLNKSNKSIACYKAAGPAAIDSLVNSLNAESIVESAQPNHILSALDAYSYVYPVVSGGPNDAAYNYDNNHGPMYTFNASYCYDHAYQGQWYISQVQADSAFAAGLTTAPPGRDIIVAVIDTGVNYSIAGNGNPDLVGVVLPGYNEITPTSQPYDDNLADSCGDAGHGTHVAGIIAANSNNSIGIASVSMSQNLAGTSKVKILPVKVLDMDGNGNDFDIYNGIEWAADNGADIINMSFGGADQDMVLEQAVNYAYGKGVLCVAAAGNDSAQTYYPAVYPNVMAVSATDITVDSCGATADVLASFSNYGKIDIAAPGVNIWSTANDQDKNPAGYSSMDGTSFSSPIVAAAAALVKLKNPSYTPDKLRLVLEQTADDDYQPCSGGNPGYDRYFGWGRVNVLRALKEDYNIPANEPAIRTYNWPNPFSPENDGFTNIVFRVTQQADITIRIYDGGNQLVWKTSVDKAGVSTTAYNTVKWNGKNTSGTGVANGVYFYVVKSSAGPYAKNKIAVLY